MHFTPFGTVVGSKSITDTLDFEQMTFKHIESRQTVRILGEWYSNSLPLDLWISFIYDVKYLRFTENRGRFLNLVVHFDWSRLNIIKCNVL